MKKVVYNISRFSKFGNTKMTGVGFITDKDLIIACVSQKGNPYIRVFEDCVKDCHPVAGKEGEFKDRSRNEKRQRRVHRLRQTRNRDRIFRMVQTGLIGGMI